MSPLTADAPALTVYDFVNQMQDLGAVSSRASARVLASKAPDSSVVMFTASKDLSLPGLRAAVLITKSSELREFVRRIQFERYYTPNPMIGLSVATYLVLLNLAHETNLAPVLGTLLAAYEPLSSILEPSLAADFERHRIGMVNNLRRSAAVLPEYSHLFANVSGELPDAGYSGLMTLRDDIVSADVELVGMSTHLLGAYDLKLNPARMFGGDLSSWLTLHGSAARIRVNLSVGEQSLRRQLDALSRALGAYE
jgi:hypothetical protein